MKRSVAMGSAVLAAAVAFSPALSATAATAPDGAGIAFPEAVEPEQAALPKEAPAGAPDAAALAEPVAADGPAAAAPAQAVTDGPRTGFEQRGGADWTTLAEEQAFLRQIDRDTNRVSVSQIGRSAQGRPLDLVQIGSGPRTQEQVAEGNTVAVLCLQHGNEPAGREGCLSFIRDLAYDTSPATTRLLRRTTVLVVPTVNPDGRAANIRANSNGIDINRDHLALETEEAQAVAELVRDYQPQVLHDAHEYGGRNGVYERDFIRLWPRNLNVNEDVRALAKSLSDDYIDPVVQYEGFTTGEYGIWYGPTGRPIAQVAGDEDERILRNAMGLRHVAGQLVESLVNDFDDDETETENKIRRVRTQVLGLQATMSFALEEGRELKRTQAAAAEAAAEEGAAGDQPIFFAGADNMLPPSSALDLTPPCAYTLTAAQYDEDVQRTLELHGIETTEAGGTVTVSMAQAAEPVIPLLLDTRANYEIAAGTQVECS